MCKECNLLKMSLCPIILTRDSFEIQLKKKLAYNAGVITHDLIVMSPIFKY